jgi:4-methyl-5(b-hydroxyethyl)-thiazole monophosphate biosynthesis
MTPVDYLRRAGVDVSIVGIAGKSAVGARGIKVEADSGPEGLARDYDCVVVPGGGKGSANLAASAAVASFIKRHFAAGKTVAAICAAPAVVLHGSCGILAGRRFTCFPGLESGVKGAAFSAERVVVDGSLITSRAAGTAGEFAYAVIAALVGEAKADEVALSVLLKA